MKKFFVISLILAILLIASCSCDDIGNESSNGISRPEFSDFSDFSVNQDPDVHESYVPVHADELSEPEHIEYPDWSKIRQPELKTLEDAQKAQGKIAKTGDIKGKKEVAYPGGLNCEEYYDSNDRAVIEIFRYGDAEPDTREELQYYETGELYLMTQYDLLMEGKPNFFKAYRKDGTLLAYGEYNDDGHLRSVTYYDENEKQITYEAYFDSASIEIRNTYYDEKIATSTYYFEADGEVGSYTEYDDAGGVHYFWEKLTWEDGTYRISERRENQEIEEFYTAGKKQYEYVKMAWTGDNSAYQILYREYYPLYSDNDFSFFQKFEFDGEHFIGEDYNEGELAARIVYANNDGNIGDAISSEIYK